MHLIVGLGNPGPKYALTRHNVGFFAIDALAQGAASEEGYTTNGQFKTEHNSLICRLNSDILLVKPQTFMNLSGEAVQAIMAYYKIHPDQLLVLHDEVDLPFSRIQFQKGRGHGGHNGIRNIHDKIGPDYARLRMGVGRPSIPQMTVADFVLQNFSAEEMNRMNDYIGLACEGVIEFIENGFTKAQNKMNTREKSGS